MFMIRAFAVWLVIIAAETVHGILRGILLVPIVGDLPARQIGVLIGSLLIFAVAYLFIRRIAARTPVCRYRGAVGRAYGPIRDRAGAARPRHAVEADHRRVRRDTLPLIYLAMKKNGSTLVEFFVDKIVGVLR